VEEKKDKEELAKASKVVFTEKDTVFMAGGGDFDDLMKSTLEGEQKETEKPESKKIEEVSKTKRVAPVKGKAEAK